MEFRFGAPLWEWSGKANWYFVTLPVEMAEDIREVPRMPRGFGSVRVRVTVGGSVWDTSIFPSSDSNSYILPVKKAVRVAEDLGEDGIIEVKLALLPE